MDNTMLQAMRDELMKISAADSPTAIGRLVNADVGKNQFPDSDHGSKHTEKRQHRGYQYPHTTTTSPNPETHSPEAGAGNGGFTYD